MEYSQPPQQPPSPERRDPLSLIDKVQETIERDYLALRAEAQDPQNKRGLLLQEKKENSVWPTRLGASLKSVFSLSWGNRSMIDTAAANAVPLYDGIVVPNGEESIKDAASNAVIASVKVTPTSMLMNVNTTNYSGNYEMKNTDGKTEQSTAVTLKQYDPETKEIKPIRRIVITQTEKGIVYQRVLLGKTKPGEMNNEQITEEEARRELEQGGMISSSQTF